MQRPQHLFYFNAVELQPLAPTFERSGAMARLLAEQPDQRGADFRFRSSRFEHGRKIAIQPTAHQLVNVKPLAGEIGIESKMLFVCGLQHGRDEEWTSLELLH